MMKRKIYWGVFSVILLLTGWMLWSRLAGTTHVALVNFPNFQIARMNKSLDTKFVRLSNVTLDDFDKLERYDVIGVFAMGIRMTDEHRAVLQRLKEKKPVFSVVVTDPTNNISSLDSIHEKRIDKYLTNGGTVNYRSLFNYIRKELTGKTLFTGEIKDPIEIGSDILFHLDEEQTFATVEAYENYYQEKGLHKPNAPKVALLVGMAGPFDTNKEHLDSLITGLENRNMNVYPISSFGKRLQFLQEIHPDLVIYMPHGRMLMGQGDRAVAWLKKQNIPLISPLTINDTYENWMKDKRGMVGGFMSQSVGMPELDGAFAPVALNAQFIDKEGLYLFKNIPGRRDRMCDLVANYLKLRTKSNKDKKVAIYYYKGPGKNALSAAGLEVMPALYNFLKRLKAEGYNLDRLPADVDTFEKMIMEQGPVFNSYAEGNIRKYLESGYPEWVDEASYRNWVKEAFTPAVQDTLTKRYGEGVGTINTRINNGRKEIAVTRIDLGNVVLLPQPIQGPEENSFAAVHGANPVPPHLYIASYLWTRNGYKADAMIHFGTHGSLEFIPGKQLALSPDDWTDQLIGPLPHFYLYTISDVGEALIAKRRSYAVTVSHLTPPFIETGLRSEVDGLLNDIKRYLATDIRDESINLKIKRRAVQMGLHRDLQLDSIRSKPYSDDEIEKIENFAEELCSEKILGGQYTLGIPYEEKKITSTVQLMCTEPIAFSLANLDRMEKKVTQKQIENQAFFNERYRTKAAAAVRQVMVNPALAESPSLLSGLGITPAKIAEATRIRQASKPKTARMMMGGPGRDKQAETFTKEQIATADAVLNVYEAIKNVNNYRESLRHSPESELQAFVNALSGGYVAPSSAGDVIADPNVLPTGRNLYGINAETTPTPAAWEKGKELANTLLAEHAKRHGGRTPEKVSFSLWSSSFVESEGATIAQILYLLGVEPIRDQFNRVLDIRLIDPKELGRPRVDVVVQTSGQFRDIAASRLSLIQKAVDMAAEANDGEENFVSKGRNDAERVLLNKGFTPKEAREHATQRVFGGANGMYGTGITGMVESGDRWEKESEIAEVYLNNMGAVYGKEEGYGSFRAGIFEAALQNTEAVVQPRQSNTWGALSLDHVYEFMGGISLTVRNVTGKDPDAYFNDLRNRHKARLQDLKTAIGVETRSTLFNPVYMREQMKEGASAANVMMETVRNTYGWNVMKPKAIDNEIWDRYYEIFVHDQLNVGVRNFFEQKNPFALQEVTAIMMETARKGYWKASEEQLKQLAELHTELIRKYEVGCSGFVCDNSKLQYFIAEKIAPDQAKAYEKQIADTRNEQVAGDENAIVMEKEKTAPNVKSEEISSFTLALITFFGITILFLIVIFVRRKMQNNRERK